MDRGPAKGIKIFNSNYNPVAKDILTYRDGPKYPNERVNIILL